MWGFWDIAIEPLLTAASPKTIVEIGAESGLHTVRLLEWAAAHRAVVHAIDPQPLFDVEQVQRQFGKAFVLHPTTSLEALPRIKKIDVLLIDGDHNWYSVFQELSLVDGSARHWPITCVHDVLWPYARRDLYYAPTLIPDEFRQPYSRDGIIEGQSELSPDGTNAGLAHATHEGGPRNGVLTAVEDFLDATRRPIELFTVNGPNGLALLIDQRDLKRGVGEVVRNVQNPAMAVVLSPNHASSYFGPLPSPSEVTVTRGG